MGEEISKSEISRERVILDTSQHSPVMIKPSTVWEQKVSQLPIIIDECKQNCIYFLIPHTAFFLL